MTEPRWDLLGLALAILVVACGVSFRHLYRLEVASYAEERARRRREDPPD